MSRVGAAIALLAVFDLAVLGGFAAQTLWERHRGFRHQLLWRDAVLRQCEQMAVRGVRVTRENHYRSGFVIKDIEPTPEKYPSGLGPRRLLAPATPAERVGPKHEP